MARLVWGIMGDARGHLTRAVIMSEELSALEILFVGGGCAHELARLGRRVVPLPMPETLLADNRVRVVATAAHFLRLRLDRNAVARELAREIERFQPDLAVTDYEYFLPHAAALAGVPCVGFGHQHVLTRCENVLPPDQLLGRITTLAAIRGCFSRPERYLLTSFFSARASEADTTVLPPLLRQDVRALSPAGGEHVLAYLRSGAPAQLLDALAACGREVRLYGMGVRPPSGGLRFLPSSRQEFLEDLAGCAYVVCGGGHNLLSEALCLGKPVLAMPARMFYEQYVNVWHLRRLGWGDFFLRAGEAGMALARFEAALPELRRALSTPPACGNEAAARAVEALSSGI